MPVAHVQHLEAIRAKLKARGIDPADAVHALDAGQPPRGDNVLVGLAQVIDALGPERCLRILAGGT